MKFIERSKPLTPFFALQNSMNHIVLGFLSAPYGKPVDIWACGCTSFYLINQIRLNVHLLGIMAELATGQALFGNKND